MKSKLAIYLSVLAMVFAFSSCANDDGDEASSPYAYIKSFSIGDVKSSYPAFTATGKENAKKDLAKIALSYPHVYVATISLGANMQQAIKVYYTA